MDITKRLSQNNIYLGEIEAPMLLDFTAEGSLTLTPITGDEQFKNIVMPWDAVENKLQRDKIKMDQVNLYLFAVKHNVDVYIQLTKEEFEEHLKDSWNYLAEMIKAKQKMPDHIKKRGILRIA